MATACLVDIKSTHAIITSDRVIPLNNLAEIGCNPFGSRLCLVPRYVLIAQFSFSTCVRVGGGLVYSVAVRRGKEYGTFLFLHLLFPDHPLPYYY